MNVKMVPSDSAGASFADDIERNDSLLSKHGAKDVVNIEDSGSKGVRTRRVPQNKFAALENFADASQEDDLIIEQVDNIDAARDDLSSQVSEFVDATQMNGEEDDKKLKTTVSERIQQDMDFLNKSWVNMAENDDAEARLLIELENSSQ
ncbi:hypothetical protein L195_g000934 [Trifolium pratense]|uniref:Uncharacterized protein n=1 Tax=Trifolium pratense TaxID=57577 RepID=A0A2K3NNB1_TRIPR|nr:hypothetical protein L195_g000934 [Trifolium pratense]